jgi:hypothetical protein
MSPRLSIAMERRDVVGASGAGNTP